MPVIYKNFIIRDEYILEEVWGCIDPCWMVLRQQAGHAVPLQAYPPSPPFLGGHVLPRVYTSQNAGGFSLSPKEVFSIIRNFSLYM